MIAGDLIIIGNGGGEFAGARGYISAFDRTTGKLRWRFFTVPRDPAKGPQDQPHLPAALKTWDPRHPYTEGSGGNVWDGMAYDPTLKLIYIGTANPGPYNSHLNGRKGGDELYTASIVAVHEDTGALAWFYQTVPGDRWDYDSTQKMILAELTFSGRQRQVLMQASKNGFYYVLDRATGELLAAKNYSYVSWTRGIDPKTGRPSIDPSADYDHGPALVFPSELGAHTWQPMAFDPGRALTFIPVVDAGNVELESSGLRAGYIDGQFTTPAFIPEAYDPEGMKSLYGALPSIAELARGLPGTPTAASTASRGFVRAWDVQQQRIVWEVQTATLFDGGVLATAGGLVFQGDGAGQLNAYASDTGKRLASIPLGSSIMAAPMTYRVHGVQYVAVMAGLGGGVMGYPFDPATAAYRYGNEGRIIALKLDGPPPPLPPAVADAALPPTPPARPTNAAEIAQGEVLYNRYCGRCHLFGRAMLPDLRRLDPATHEVFNQIVRGGALSALGMGRFDDVLSIEDTDAIHAYIIDQAWQLRQTASAAASSPSPPAAQ
jgi:quinohemoprotein ethanol dehydrogenase